MSVARGLSDVSALSLLSVVRALSRLGRVLLLSLLGLLSLELGRLLGLELALAISVVLLNVGLGEPKSGGGALEHGDDLVGFVSDCDEVMNVEVWQ